MKINLKKMRLLATICKISNLCRSGGIVPLQYASENNFKTALYYDLHRKLENGDYLIVDSFYPDEPSRPSCYFWPTSDYEIAVSSEFLQPYIHFLDIDDCIIFDDHGNWYMAKTVQLK